MGGLLGEVSGLAGRAGCGVVCERGRLVLHAVLGVGA